MSTPTFYFGDDDDDDPIPQASSNDLGKEGVPFGEGEDPEATPL